MSEQGKFAQLNAALKAGEITRRQFMERSTALGVGFGVALFCANAAHVAAKGGSKNGYAFYGLQDGAAVAPNSGTEGQERGAGGDLRLIQWQAATVASPHSATGTKDFLAGSIVVEPLMHYLPDGTIIPNLVQEVPSIENGLLAEDLTSVTFNLTEGITWSDGEPFTANDVIFTHAWIVNTENASVSFEPWDRVESIEAPDDLTVQVTYKAPAAAWFETFTGGIVAPIYPQHIFGATLEEAAANRNDAFLTAPVGTGPYVVESFQPNGEQVFAINENYREPNKPFFERVIITGGGDAAAAARTVAQAGEGDYAWNIQVEPAVLDALTAESEAGTVSIVPVTNVERININFSDPATEVNGQRSEKNTPHPILADLKVRQALNMAVPREVIATEFYGPGQNPTANIVAGFEATESPNTSFEYNLEGAAALLDEAGWTLDGEVRVKDGREFELSYATSINQVRQKTQAVVQQAWGSLGIRVQLQQVDAGIFFDGSAGNEQNLNHFYTDINMYTNGAGSPVPVSYMVGWFADEDGRNIAQLENDWQGQNVARWQNAEYDELFRALQQETDIEAAYATIIQMNDILINDVALIPEVNRGSVQVIANTLNPDNIAVSSFELDYWNIANWNRVS